MLSTFRENKCLDTSTTPQPQSYPHALFSRGDQQYSEPRLVCFITEGPAKRCQTLIHRFLLNFPVWLEHLLAVVLQEGYQRHVRYEEHRSIVFSSASSAAAANLPDPRRGRQAGEGRLGCCV